MHTLTVIYENVQTPCPYMVFEDEADLLADADLTKKIAESNLFYKEKVEYFKFPFSWCSLCHHAMFCRCRLMFARIPKRKKNDVFHWFTIKKAGKTSHYFISLSENDKALISLYGDINNPSKIEELAKEGFECSKGGVFSAEKMCKESPENMIFRFLYGILNYKEGELVSFVRNGPESSVIAYGPKLKRKHDREFFQLVEHNQWEGETWNFYFPCEENEEAAKKIAQLIKKTEDDDGECDFELDLDVKLKESEVDALVKHGGTTSYMKAHNKLEGYVDFNRLTETQDLYKGGVESFMSPVPITDSSNLPSAKRVAVKPKAEEKEQE